MPKYKSFVYNILHWRTAFENDVDSLGQFPEHNCSWFELDGRKSNGVLCLELNKTFVLNIRDVFPCNLSNMWKANHKYTKDALRIKSNLNFSFFFLVPLFTFYLRDTKKIDSANLGKKLYHNWSLRYQPDASLWWFWEQKLL